MALEKGTRFGSYEILESIGTDSEGEAYKASDTEHNRTVRVRVLPPQLLENAQRKEGFERAYP